MTSRYFVAFCVQNTVDVAPCRFGFTCPRALGKAVVRNRLKRRMREAVRTHLASLSAGWAVVFNPLDAPFEDLCREVGRVLARCKQS
jgi:ribonuclease P protein component